MFLGNDSQAEVITDLLSNVVQESSKSWLLLHRPQQRQKQLLSYDTGRASML